MLKALSIFCCWTVSSASTPLQSQQLTPFLNTLAELVQTPSHNIRDVAVQCLEALLARRECRLAVWAVPGIVAGYVTYDYCNKPYLMHVFSGLLKYSSISLALRWDIKWLFAYGCCRLSKMLQSKSTSMFLLFFPTSISA